MTNWRIQIEPALAEGRRFWRWWTGELGAAIPQRLRQCFDRRERADIRLGRDSIAISCMRGSLDQRFEEDRPLEALDPPAWDELAAFLMDRSARVILAASDRLCLTLDLPRRTGRNLPAAIALQLGFASPIDPEQACWSWAVLSADRDRVTVLVVLTRSSRLDTIESLFARHGLSSPPIYCETPAGLVRIREGRVVLRSVEGERNSRALIAATLILVMTPLLLLIGAQIMSVRKEAQLDMLRRELAPKIAADNEARREARLWQAYAPLRRLPSANIILADLGRRAPSGTSIDTLTVTPDRRIRFELVGAQDERDVTAMIASDGLLLLSSVPDNDESGPVIFTAELP